MTEDEMAGWHHRLDGHESEQAPGVGDGQGGLACCSPWGHKEQDRTELNCVTAMDRCTKIYLTDPLVGNKTASNLALLIMQPIFFLSAHEILSVDQLPGPGIAGLKDLCV